MKTSLPGDTRALRYTLRDFMAQVVMRGDGEGLDAPQQYNSASTSAELNGDIAINRFFC